ncbi:MAG: hypothetical protein V4597_19320 [Pseudomonadota bacterium]
MTDQPPDEPTPRAEVLLTRAAFDMAAKAINAMPPEEAFEAALALLAEHRNLTERCIGLRDIQALRVYEDRSLTLVQLAETLRWGPDRGGIVTRGRMGQVVANGRKLRDGTTPTANQPDPAA